MDAPASSDPAPQLFCANCGASIRATAKFCGGCGVAGGLPPRSVPISGAPAATTSKPYRLPLLHLALSGTGLVILIAAVAWLLFVRAGGGLTQQYVTRLVRMRNSTDVAVSSVLGALHRGDAIKGSWVVASDGHTRWLKIKTADGAVGYVWGQNLSSNLPPRLATTEDADITLPSDMNAYAQPAATGPATPLAGSQRVHETGVLASGWREVELPAGGVGYLAPGPKTVIGQGGGG